MGLEGEHGCRRAEKDSEDLGKMISPREISQQAFRKHKPDKVIEKDYVMTWILLGMSDSRMSDYCIFKGGTALKKIYFPDYRYSEDLDFTLTDEEASERLFDDLRHTLNCLQDSQALVFGIEEKRIERRADSLTLYIDYVGPLQARLGSRGIKIDFTLKERVVCEVEEREVITTYSDCEDTCFQLKVYKLEEILIEKLCALIGRTEPRDLYDADWLLKMKDLDFQTVAEFFPHKARNRNIDPKRLASILRDKRAIMERLWENRLGHQVDDLPHLEEVIRETNRFLRLYGLA